MHSAGRGGPLPESCGTTCLGMPTRGWTLKNQLRESIARSVFLPRRRSNNAENVLLKAASSEKQTNVGSRETSPPTSMERPRRPRLPERAGPFARAASPSPMTAASLTPQRGHRPEVLRPLLPSPPAVRVSRGQRAVGLPVHVSSLVWSRHGATCPPCPHPSPTLSCAGWRPCRDEASLLFGHCHVPASWHQGGQTTAPRCPLGCGLRAGHVVCVFLHFFNGWGSKSITFRDARRRWEIENSVATKEVSGSTATPATAHALRTAANAQAHPLWSAPPSTTHCTRTVP